MSPLISEPKTAQSQVRSLALVILSVLAVFYTLHLARVVLIPVTVALLLHLLFNPLVRRLKRAGVPSSASAAVIVLLLIGVFGGATSMLLDPAMAWLKEAPITARQLAREFDEIKKPLEEIRELSDEVGEMTALTGDKPQAQAVEIAGPTALDRAVRAVPAAVFALAVTFLTTFFLLAGGEAQSRHFLAFGKTWQAKRQIIRVMREIQDEVSRHLRTILIINIVLGTVVGLVLWQIGIPNPGLWGTMVAMLNFAPYVGAIISAAVLGVISMITFGSVTEALMVAGIFILINGFEGMVITPLILGKRLALSPLVVFLSVILWGWLWGIVGALIAVPLVSSLKVVLSHIEATRPLANLMGNAWVPPAAAPSDSADTGRAE